MEVSEHVLAAFVEDQKPGDVAIVGADNEAKIVFDWSNGIVALTRKVIIGLFVERKHSTRVPVFNIPACISKMFPRMILIISICNSSSLTVHQGQCRGHPHLRTALNIHRGRAAWYPYSLAKTSHRFFGTIGPSGKEYTHAR